MTRRKQVQLVKDPEVGEAVDTEEQVDNRRDDGEPEAPGLPGEEVLPKVEGAVNPEKLAGNQQHEEKEFDIEPGAKPEGAKDNQQDRDRVIVSSEEAIIPRLFVVGMGIIHFLQQNEPSFRYL